jgi:hypothetical protein
MWDGWTLTFAELNSPSVIRRGVGALAGRDGRSAACSAVRGGLQPPVAAANDRHEWPVGRLVALSG